MKKKTAIPRPLLYNSVSSYYRSKYGRKIKRISVDTGYGCPNLDGTLSGRGCVYCNNSSFSNNYKTGLTLKKQIEKTVNYGLSQNSKAGYIVYFQPGTNTYAPLEKIREDFETALSFNEVVGIAIGTRPDYIDEKIIQLFSEFAQNHEIWVELGLQSSNNETLKRINRNHTFSQFQKAAALIKSAENLKLAAHIIIGLPGETEKEYLCTAMDLKRAGIDGIKIHPLYVAGETELFSIYEKGEVKLLEMKEYMRNVAKILCILDKETVIFRICGRCSADLLTAPDWIRLPSSVQLECLKNIMEEGSWQGKTAGE